MKLHNWNDARLLIACAEKGGFAGAADALSMDQKTISRRIGQLEEAIGRRLFSRRKTGSTLTPAGRALLERAAGMDAAARELEMAMRGLSGQQPVVTLSAPEGVLTYLLIPLLLGSANARLPLDRGLLKAVPPNLTFVTPPDLGDINLFLHSAGETLARSPAEKVRTVASFRMVTVMAPGFFAQRRQPRRFDDLVEQPLVDLAAYRSIRSLDGWNMLVAAKTGAGLIVAHNTTGMHGAVAAGAGIGLAPDHVTLWDERLAVLDIPLPSLTVDLCLAAHPDVLREPTIHQLYDDLAKVFRESAWFQRG